MGPIPVDHRATVDPITITIIITHGGVMLLLLLLGSIPNHNGHSVQLGRTWIRRGAVIPRETPLAEVVVSIIEDNVRIRAAKTEGIH